MRYLIVSDMHGNSDAFRAVIESVAEDRLDASLVLGDLVGYGGGPNEVVAALDDLPGTSFSVRGNHDKVVAEIEDGRNFNPAALEAARWTTANLTPEKLAFVKALPEGPMMVEDDLAICHGSPIDEDMYVFSDYDAYLIFTAHRVPVTFIGHTHIPSIFKRLENGGIEVALLRGETGTIEIEEGQQYLLNPGSIGQPRDRDPRAAFMIYDSDDRVVTWRRLDYPIEKAQQRILDAGLPKVLADRLAVGV